MSEKVKITECELDLIESFKEDFHMNFYGMSLNKFILALKEGYEVEPEFECGDWVVFFSRTLEDYVTRKVIVIYTETGFVTVDREHFSIALERLRHATESEIQEEKERRFWGRLGRNINEFYEGDVVETNSGFISTVLNIDITGVLLKNFDNVQFPVELTLICPKESRLDVNHDD